MKLVRVCAVLLLVTAANVDAYKFWKAKGKKGPKYSVGAPQLVYLPHPIPYEQPAYHAPAYHEPAYHEPVHHSYAPAYRVVPKYHKKKLKHKKPKGHYKDYKDDYEKYVKLEKVFWKKTYLGAKLLAKTLPVIVKILAKKSKKKGHKKYKHAEYYPEEHYEYAPAYPSYDYQPEPVHVASYGGYETKEKSHFKELKHHDKHDFKHEFKGFKDDLKGKLKSKLPDVKTKLGDAIDLDDLATTLKDVKIEDLPGAVLETLVGLLSSDDKLPKELDATPAIRLLSHEVTSKELIPIEHAIGVDRHVRQANKSESSYTSYRMQ